jgi:hypothetical protein
MPEKTYRALLQKSPRSSFAQKAPQMDIRGFFGGPPAPKRTAAATQEKTESPAKRLASAGQDQAETASPRRATVHAVVAAPEKIEPVAKRLAAAAAPGHPEKKVASPSPRRVVERPAAPVVLPSQAAEMWPDRHRPRNLREIVGNQGAVQKLLDWLKTWDKVHLHGGAPSDALRTSGGGPRGHGQGAAARAALLSGPPGIGKTTTAQLVCREAGLTPIEFNASDTRSKNALQLRVSQMVQSHSVSSGGARLANCCLIMDEVDGMSGGDRGGMAELILVIKKSKVISALVYYPSPRHSKVTRCRFRLSASAMMRSHPKFARCATTASICRIAGTLSGSGCAVALTDSGGGGTQADGAAGGRATDGGGAHRGLGDRQGGHGAAGRVDARRHPAGAAHAAAVGDAIALTLAG